MEKKKSEKLIQLNAKFFSNILNKKKTRLESNFRKETLNLERKFFKKKKFC